ncbi:MAG: EAL domain-containing protein, partial [Pseudomonadota bacterium]
ATTPTPPMVAPSTKDGVGVVAISMLVISLFKRSAVAAVSFSFLALTTLILGMLYGRFDFLPMGTQTLLGCLFACSFLLFTTATIRLARENPFVGAVILMVIAALLVTGGGALLNMIDGRQLASFGLMIALALGAILMCVEIIRGDRPTLAMAPGLLCLFISPFLMRYIGGAASVTAWWAVSFPLMMLAVGTVYVTVIAQIILSLSARQGVRAANLTTVSARTATAAAPAAVFGMHEVADEDHHHERSEFSYNAPSSEEYDEAMDEGDLAEDHVAPQTVQHEYAAVPQTQGDVEEGADVREEKETAHPTAPYQPISVSAVEPVSAQWGTTNDPSSVSSHPVEAPSSPVFTVADDEYVWDSIADQEVKVGAGFADLLGLTQEGRTLSPDVMRDALAPASLGDFDDAILGGAEPETGRFNLALTTGEGRVIGVEGRRQVDHDGILSRIEAQAKLLSSPKATSPMGGRDVDRMATAPLTATPLAASPIAQKTAHEQSAKGQSSTKVIEGLERGEIEAHFQPIVRLSDGKTVGFEALARWHHPNGDVQDAKDFVSDLIKADRGLDLARLVIDHAASELSAWIAAEPGQGQ